MFSKNVDLAFNTSKDGNDQLGNKEMTPIAEAPGESTSKTPMPNDLNSGSIFDEVKGCLLAKSENLNLDNNL
jgi:hypothetical protein